MVDPNILNGHVASSLLFIVRIMMEMISITSTPHFSTYSVPRNILGTFYILIISFKLYSNANIITI